MYREHRNAYLSAMGIDLWQPIKSLPGAEPGHWIANPDDHRLAVEPSIKHNEDQFSHSINASEASSSPPAHRDRLIAELKGIDRNSSVRAETLPVSAKDKVSGAKVIDRPPAATILSAAEILTVFTLTASYSHGLLIVDDVSDLHCANSAYQSWIHSVLFSLGHKVSHNASSASQQDQFVWPLPERSLSANSNIAAKDIFAAWLQRRVEEHNIHQLLLMGRVSNFVAAYDSNPNLFSDNKTASEKHTVDILTTHSSAELWAQPHLKHVFWRCIQSFRKITAD